MDKKIYIDWDNSIVITDPEEYIDNYISDYIDDKYTFEDWLNDKYSASDLWDDMDGKLREIITEEWKDYLRSQAVDDFVCRFDEIDVHFSDEE